MRRIILNEQQINQITNGTILYHGDDIEPDLNNRDTLWLTDDIHYAKSAGDKVYCFWISNNLDIASKEILKHAFEIGEFGEGANDLDEILWEPTSSDSFLDWIIQNGYEAFETNGIDGEYFLCVFPSIAITTNSIKQI